MNLPIIKLEVQSMAHTMKTMLTQHAAQVDADLQQAVESYCAEGNIARVVREEARRQLDMALKEEVRRFFDFSGPGRLAVREAVTEFLNERYPLKVDV
jgi:hypothetical protein